MSYSFRPSLWSIAGTLLGCAVLALLGFWQVQRGHEKARLIAQYEDASHAAPVLLDATASASKTVAAGAARAIGHYLPRRQVLLDGQSRGADPGFNVWTPLRLVDGGVVMVNRGWIPQLASRKNLPPLPVTEDQVEVHGLWRALPVPPLRLGEGNCPAGKPPESAFPMILEYPTADELRCLLGEPVLAGELLLDRDSGEGFVRDWLAAPSEMPPSRHYGYAAQWFAFAATLFGLFIKINLKKSAPGSPT